MNRDYSEPNAITGFHLFERVVDIVEVLAVGNDFMYLILAQIWGYFSRKLLTFVHFQFAGHVVVHEAWELGAAFDTPKGTTLPHTPGDQLECFFFLSVPGRDSK